MKISAIEIMISDERYIESDTTLVDAAKIMSDFNLDVLPVRDHGRLAGMLTERDIVVNGIACDRDPRLTTVLDAMGTIYLYDDQDHDAEETVKTRQSRLPSTLDHENGTAEAGSLEDFSVSIKRALSVPRQ